jgi:hypothetical protein
MATGKRMEPGGEKAKGQANRLAPQTTWYSSP